MNETEKQITLAIALLIASVLILYINNKVKNKHYDMLVTIALLFYLAAIAIIFIATFRFF